MPSLSLDAEIADPLFRFAAGQDDKDEALLASAFAADARLDFRHPASRFGASMPVLRGREQIVEVIVGSTVQLETTHSITNLRYSSLSDGEASVAALIEAMHVDGKAPDRRLLLKNRIAVQVQSGEDGWRIQEMVFTNRWHEGDPSVLFGAADGPAT